MKNLLFSLSIIFSLFVVASCSEADATRFKVCEEHVKNCPVSEDCPEHPVCEAHEKCAKDKDCKEHPDCEAFEHR